MTVSDLSPDALAELEAKLVADLDMVRKVRALLMEHRGVTKTASLAPPPPSEPPAPSAVVPPVFVPPPQPSRSLDDILTECLLDLPDEPFAPKDLASKAAKPLRNYPEGSVIKAFLGRMIRKGHVVVVEVRAGRNGSLYRCTMPRPTVEPPPAPVETPTT